MSGVAYDYMEEYIRGLIPESTGKLKELEDRDEALQRERQRQLEKWFQEDFD